MFFTDEGTAAAMMAIASGCAAHTKQEVVRPPLALEPHLEPQEMVVLYCIEH